MKLLLRVLFLGFSWIGAVAGAARAEPDAVEALLARANQNIE